MTSLRDAARQALEQLRCNTDNMEKGMSKSIQKLCAKANREVMDTLRTAILYPGTEYEQGFIDGMSEQARRSVDRAVNAMAKSMEERQ